MAKDDNDLAREGRLPNDPEEGAVEMKDPEAKPAPEPEKLQAIGDTFKDALDRSMRRLAKKEQPIPLPWPQLAEQFGGGLWPGVHVLVGSTGSGKTAWALQIAYHAAKLGFPVGYVGLELEAMQIALRLIGEAAGDRPGEKAIPWSSMYLGKADGHTLARAGKVAEEIRDLPYYVEFGSAGGWAASELEGLVTRMRAKYPEKTERKDDKDVPIPGSKPMLVVLDFLQIIGSETTDKRMELRERIGRAAYFARDVARRHNVAVILVSSAARAAYGALSGLASDAGFVNEGGHRRMKNPDALVGLGKESGEIEYSADSVTAAIKMSSEVDRKVVFATAKGRATGAGWTVLEFNGFRFKEPLDADSAAEEMIKMLKKAAAEETKPKKVGTAPETPKRLPPEQERNGGPSI